MSATAAPAAAPAAPSTAPATDVAAPAVDAGAKPDAVPAGKPDAAPAAPESVNIGGRSFTVAQLEAAIAASANVAQAFKDLQTQRAEFEAKVAGMADRATARRLLKEYGHDEAKLAEDILVEHLENEQLSPAERELAEYRRKDAEAKASEKAAKEKAEQEAKDKQAQELEAQLAKAYEDTMVAALSEAGLPRTAETALDMLQIIRDGLDAGYEVTAAQAAQLLKVKYVDSQARLYESMSVEQLHKALPAKVIKALIDDHAAKLKAGVSRAPDAPANRVTGGKRPSAPSDASLDSLINKLTSAPRRR